ncbi:Uncharacterised protein [uncultured archaeon]|nr:Uncharacterised protein [uncultured archaeon]
MDFHLESMKVNGMYFDIDNLCEPIFSVLINKKGWFGGKRPNLKWFRATKLKDLKQGCCFKIYNSLESVSPISCNDVIYSKTYAGNLPKSATDAEFISWIEENYSELKHISSFYVKIEFSSSTINLGDIATGRIKSIVDCLYPIIGGNKGSPDDWKINILEVAKGVKTIPKNSVKVSITEFS